MGGYTVKKNIKEEKRYPWEWWGWGKQIIPWYHLTQSGATSATVASDLDFFWPSHLPKLNANIGFEKGHVFF